MSSHSQSAVGGDDDFVKLDQLGNVLEEQQQQQQQQQQQEMRDPRMVNADELRSQLLPVWQKLWDFEPECLPFRYPVDPVALHIPDYFDFVKNPMDLHTIKAKLDEGKYKNAWQFCDHVWLMFENAWLYNSKKTKVHQWCTKMSHVFSREIDPVVRNLGYCCGQRLSNVECSWFNWEAVMDLDLENKKLKDENNMLKNNITKLEGQVLEDKLSKELQSKMDEFKEEYAKKLSLQNNQMEELKKAFSVCQQKVEEFKEKLAGMKGIEEQDKQQKMALATASMPTNSPMDLTMCTQWTKNYDCLLNGMKGIEKQDQQQQQMALAAESRPAKTPIDSTISDQQDYAKINDKFQQIDFGANKIDVMRNKLAAKQFHSCSTSTSSIGSSAVVGLEQPEKTPMTALEKMEIMGAGKPVIVGGIGNKPFTGHPQQQMGQQQLHSVCIGPNIHAMTPPEPPSEAKTWHASVTPHERSHLIGKLVKALIPLPDPDPASITRGRGKKIKKWIKVARKLEKEMFELAPDKAAYDHMLIEKIYKFQKKVQKKQHRQLTKLLQRQQHEQQQQNGEGAEEIK